jgi:Rad3-related DNA helicase
MDLNWRLPPWATHVRDHQVEAIEQIIDEYRHGQKLVILDAPTGSGKTLIAELVRQTIARTNQKSSYVCSSLTLQDQFADDFPNAHIIRGRGNYPTVFGGRSITAADCAGKGCSYCPEDRCPYQVAREDAEASQIAVLNSTYQLYSSNYTKFFRKRDFVIVDECDTLESEVMRFAECTISWENASRVGMQIPKQGVRYTTIASWLEQWVVQAEKYSRQFKGSDPEVIRAKRKWDGLIRAASMVKNDLLVNQDLWIRQPSTRSLSMKPVRIDRFMDDLVWQHGDRWLLMSATVVSPEVMVRDLGWTGSWGYVQVPMTFPVENRKIIARGNIDMAAKNKKVAWPQMVDAVDRVLAEHPDDNVLVHTVSYELASYLYDRCGGDHEAFTYSNARSRASVLEAFKRESRPAVLFAPSMDRGVDLPDDLCRVQVVAKVPFPYLGDRQVSARMRLPGGQAWYAVETVRTLVQMTGRGVRNASDWCVTYILDGQFKKNVLARNRRLLPAWWLEAVERQ